jgi:hypothetical protein
MYDLTLLFMYFKVTLLNQIYSAIGFMVALCNVIEMLYFEQNFTVLLILNIFGKSERVTINLILKSKSILD